ncbi:MAG: ribosome maturation factor RimP [Rhodocyclales bacterium]|nr:ribosome maturation factor RimP [Rhodocyclales bacterium]
MQLVELIEQAVAGLGYELVDFEASPRARLLRVLIDKEAGISVDDCALVSNHLTRLFTVESIDYDRLEVSSPGLDRPLKKPADFVRFAGQEAQFKLRVPVGNQRNFKGTILGVADDRVRFSVEGVETDFPLDNVEKARLVPKF